jgi:CheY-like chemotaxis protein
VVPDAAGADSVLVAEEAWDRTARPPAVRALALRSASSREVGPAPPGAAAVLRKPVRRSQLLAALREAAAAPAAPPPAPGAAVPGRRVLVAEDNPVNQLIVERMLRNLGAECVLVPDGGRAVERAAAGGFDLVLMDCQMPVMDGFEAARAIREREARCGGHVPIVALTASAMVEDREHALAAGMDDHVAKPVSAAQLRATLDRWCVRPGDGAPPSAG